MRAILTYHSVDASQSPISIDEAAFRRHVAWLASGAVRVVPLVALPDAEAHADAVALTFDDGFANFGEAAWPALRDHGLPVTLFVVSGHVGGRNDWHAPGAVAVPTLPLLTWDRLGRLAEEGVTLGAHTCTHPDLTALGDPALAQELEACAEAIAAHTGARPATFAYPYGRLDARVGAAASRVYTHAVTTDLRPMAAGEDPLHLPRLDAFYLRGPGRLESWGTPAFARYLLLRRAARGARALVGRWLGTA
jgi:peptidoglycan/xylan/chitin deacetylase (PgdA/CDA1 family)